MSATIIKTGIWDTIQDLGRFGHQWLGINPGGAMDLLSMQVANLLVGNERNSPVIEMHFPAAVIRFDNDCLIALAGANFLAMINDTAVPLHQPILISAGSILSFGKRIAGARIYLAIHGGWVGKEWLNSHSTQALLDIAGAKLQQQIIQHAATHSFSIPVTRLLPWHSNVYTQLGAQQLSFIPGREWNQLEPDAMHAFCRELHVVDAAANRMGYALRGPSLQRTQEGELISSAVTRGTIQLLPNRQCIALMADHQTTGGYPRIAHLLSTHCDRLAQLNTGDSFFFQKTDLTNAHQQIAVQERDLMLLQNACTFKWQALRSSISL